MRTLGSAGMSAVVNLGEGGAQDCIPEGLKTSCKARQPLLLNEFRQQGPLSDALRRYFAAALNFSRHFPTALALRIRLRIRLKLKKLRVAFLRDNGPPDSSGFCSIWVWPSVPAQSLGASLWCEPCRSWDCPHMAARDLAYLRLQESQVHGLRFQGPSGVCGVMGSSTVLGAAAIERSSGQKTNLRPAIYDRKPQTLTGPKPESPPGRSFAS